MNLLVVRQAEFVRFLQSRQAKYLTQGLNLLLMVWIAAQLATLTWDILSPVETTVSTAAPAQQSIENPDRQLIDQLPTWHLMGEAKQAPATLKTGAPLNAPDTRLKLTLRGTLATDDPGIMRAIISDPGGKDEPFAIGDTLSGNVELSKVFHDRVILKRNGRYETLRLPKADINVNLRGNSRRQVTKKPASLYGLVHATPAHLKDGGADGSILGYTLSPGSDKAFFDKLGLEAGDVVLRVNDIRLETIEVGEKALKDIEIGDSVNLTVLRGDLEYVINVFLPEE